MNSLVTFSLFLMNHEILTFVVIVTFGLIWIYFQVPNIKTKTTPPNGVKSSCNEWIEARKTMNKYSFTIFAIGLIFAYGVSEYIPDGKDDPIPYFLNCMTAICFLTAVGMQFLNKKVSALHINNHGDTK